jgi:MerR family transcriptional regulator, redox-sensitive transcriptional activator SoxR
MPHLSISEVARQAGLRPSAIRYYEQIGILMPAERVSGQRRYDASMIYRLAVVQRAREIGFTLEEIRELFFGFRNATPASRRWQALSERKLVELDGMMERIRTIQGLLHRMKERCHCETLEQCGRGIFNSGCGNAGAEPEKRRGLRKSLRRTRS